MRDGAAAPPSMMCSEPVRLQRPRGADVSSPEVIEGRDGGWDVSSQGSRVTRAWEVWRRDVSTPEPRTGAIGAGTSRPRKFRVARGGHGDETSPVPSWSALNCASLRASAVGFTMNHPQGTGNHATEADGCRSPLHCGALCGSFTARSLAARQGRKGRQETAACGACSAGQPSPPGKKFKVGPELSELGQGLSDYIG